MKKYQYNIHNLDCANCARKLEEKLGEDQELNKVIVNFNTCKLSFESNKDINIASLNAKIQKYEPEAYLSEEEGEKKKDYLIYTLILGTMIGLVSYFLKIDDTLKYILYAISYGLLLHRVFIKAIKLLIKSFSIDENLLITISSIGALIIGSPLEGMMVIFLYSIGKILEGRALNNSRKSIRDLMNLKEPFAYVENGKEVYQIKVEEVKVGDIVIVKKGEKVPVDGQIIKGETYLDMASLTGESRPVLAKLGDDVLSGSINNGDVIKIKVMNSYNDSTVAKILELLEKATNKKAKTETIIAKYSKYYTMMVLLLSLIVIFFLPLLGVSKEDSIYRGLTFLVVSCPCAIAISIPLSYFTGIGVCSKWGILVKGSNYLDNLSNAQNIIFDKTGTLTKGSFAVLDIQIEDDSYSKEEIINILCQGESLSNHPIAKSIMKLTEKKINNNDVKAFKEISGKGISFEYKKKIVKIGNSSFCHNEKDEDLHLNIDNKHVATIIIDDELKENSKEVITKLKALGLKIWMYTGDKEKVAKRIGEKMGIDEIRYELLPQDKYEEYEKINSEGLSIFVGDGVNDAPVLKRSDIGISMGGVGADSAIEASDIVLMEDKLDRILLAFEISKYTKYIIKQNLIFAIVTKIIVLILSTLGLTNMWLAVFADTGVTLLTILNTLRILTKYHH